MKHSTLLIGALSFALLVACTPTTNTTDTSSAKRMPMQWTATHTGADKDGVPESTIDLKVVGSTDALYSTTCLGVPSTEGITDVDGSVASIQCWWAGGGDQYGVFVGNAEELTVKTRTVDEEAGYGDWKDLKKL